MILLDARRKINSGVGRVSQWLAQNLPQVIATAEFKYLVTNFEACGDYGLKEENCLECDIIPFSEEEFLVLPTLIDKLNADLYITPQTTWSPLIETPSITMIHDLWAINTPEWLPSESDIMHRFHLHSTGYLDQLIRWFDNQDPQGLLTEEGLKRFNQADKLGNRVHKGVWAQYAAMIKDSSATVTVSSFIHTEVRRLFCSEGKFIKNIPNVASGYVNSSLGERKRDILLTLSKIENRKNLHYLLDEYVLYASQTTSPLPLVIAGDPGYKSKADKFIGRVNELQNGGYDVRFLPSVSDSKLRKLFSMAACMIFPSHFEGFGLPAIEALLSETPLICTSTGVICSELTGQGHFINGDLRGELAIKIEDLVVNPPSKEILKKGREAALEYTNRNNSSQLWSDTILSLTSHGGGLDR